MDDERLMMVTKKGQTTIPKEFRERLDIDAPGRVTMEATDEGVLLKRVPRPAELTGDLAGETDDEGRTLSERLRDERRADAEAEEITRSNESEDGDESTSENGNEDPKLTSTSDGE